MQMRTRFALLSLALLAAGCRKADPLLQPTPERVAAAAPDSSLVRATTTKGEFDLMIRRDWAPLGADRFHYLVESKFYDQARFFRVLRGFVAQFGAPGDSAVGRVWRELRLKDDSVKVSNRRGTLTFATGGPNTRTTQLFINFRDNARLDGMGFAPIGEVVRGMEVVDSLYAGYGEGAPSGTGPDQRRIAVEGNGYLAREFPLLDFITSARVVTRYKRKRS